MLTYEWISVYRLFLIIDFVVIGKHAYGKDSSDYSLNGKILLHFEIFENVYDGIVYVFGSESVWRYRYFGIFLCYYVINGLTVNNCAILLILLLVPLFLSLLVLIYFLLLKLSYIPSSISYEIILLALIKPD